MTTRRVDWVPNLGVTPQPVSTCPAVLEFKGHPTDWQCELPASHIQSHRHASPIGVTIEWTDNEVASR